MAIKGRALYINRGQAMLTFITVLFLMSDAQAQHNLVAENRVESESESEGESSNEKTKTFTAKVRIVREDSDGMEIFFESEKAKGAYLLPSSAERYGKKVKDLEASKKPNGAAVTVTVDSEKRIKSVVLQKNDSRGIKGFKIPSDPNQKWDFGKLPDNL